jgi:hypothetical protein
MEKIISAQEAKDNFFKIIDKVILTNKAQYIFRDNVKLKISVDPKKEQSIFDRITTIDNLIVGDIEDLENSKVWEFDPKKYDDIDI